MRRAAFAGLTVMGVLLASSGFAQQPATSAATPGERPAPAATPAAAPTSASGARPTGTAAPRSGKAKRGAAAPSKRTSRKAHAKEPPSHPVRPGAAVAEFPGFKMLPDGGSRVFVEVSKKIEITEHKAEGRLTYRLHGAEVPVRTNRLPIDTTFFQTPVGRIQLVESGEDADLVIETRVPTDAQHRLIEQDGTVVLQVDFPRANGVPIGPGPRPTAASGSSGSNARRRHD